MLAATALRKVRLDAGKRRRPRVGLRAKFNLLVLVISAVGVALFTLAANSLVNSVAREEVLQSSRIMMESAAGARKYTSEQIAPILKPMIGEKFFPQSVSAYAAKRNFDVIHAKFPSYVYREAALNPSNPEDRASDWEADIINDFRAHPDKTEISAERMTPTGPMLELARPLVNKPACLECHNTAATAPASMIALYGGDNGFGWKSGEIIGAQIVSVPMSESSVRAEQIRKLFVAPFVGFLLLLFVAINLLLHFVVIRPIERIAQSAEAISMGKIDTPEYQYRGEDQIGRLSASFNRMHRSLVEAFRLLGQD
jgi:protein-histidine pros-kinase